MVEVFDGLFETDRNTKAEDYGGDVDEEVTPGGGGVVGGVDVEHGGGFLGRRFKLRRVKRRLWRR